MGAEQDVGTAADGFPHRANHPGRQIDVGQQRLVPALHAVRARRIEFDRGEALPHGFKGCGGGKVGIVVDIFRAVG